MRWVCVVIIWSLQTRIEKSFSYSISYSYSNLKSPTMCESAAIFEVFILIINFHIVKWRILKIGSFKKCLVVQTQTIPRKLNGRKFKPSLNVSQEISGPDSLPTAGIFGTFG